jgi:hypothetical protein
MRSVLKDEKGFTTTVFAIFMPVLLAFLALCSDGVTVIYYRISLETAADAASLAGIDSYDRDIWYNDNRIVLRQEEAEQLAREILEENFSPARLLKVEIPEDQQNTCIVEAEVEAPLHFLQIFGVEAKIIRTVSLAHGYD